MLKNKRNLIYIIAIVLLIVSVALFFISISKKDDGKFQKFDYLYSFDSNLGSFSEDAWNKNEGVTIFYADPEYDRDLSKDNKGCLNINNSEANDARYVYKLDVHKDAYYYVGAWIQTADIDYHHVGANISVLDNSFYIGDLRGSQEWKYVEGILHAPVNMKINIALRIGGYSNDNTGQAWFDDFKIESFEEIPKELRDVKVYELASKKNAKEDQRTRVIQYMNPYIVMFLSIVILFLLIYISLYKDKNKPFAKGKAWIFTVLGLAFLMRFIIAPFITGFGSDVALFKSWAIDMSNNPLNFYDVAVNCDYPPLYIYIIGAFAKLGQLLGIARDSALFTLIIKLPPIIADLISGFLIYKLSQKINVKDNWRIFFAAIYVFNPMVILDSTIWGQVDSVWALTILLGIYCTVKEKYLISASVLALSLMIKPQGLFVCPVLILAVIKRKDIVRFFLCGAIVIGTLLVTTLPYTLAKGPLWIFEQMLGTAGGYKYASVNSFNFYTLLGLNWVKDNNTFLGISYFLWGLIFAIIILTLTTIIYFKMRKDYKNLPYLAALILSVWIVVFFVRMHERYMFPAIIFSLVLAIIDNSRLMFKIHALITTTSFFNSLIILGRLNTTGDIHHFDGVLEVVIISALNIVTAILIGIYTFKRMKNNNDKRLYTIDDDNDIISDCINKQTEAGGCVHEEK